MKLFLTILISLIYSQTFDPTTGEIIHGADSIKIQFDPITGEKNNNVLINKQQYVQYGQDYSNDEIKYMAISDVNKYFNQDVKMYKLLGGPTSLLTIPPATMLGMGIGILFAGDEGGPTPILGFFGGFGASFFGIPRLIANINSKPIITLELNHVKSLSKPQQKIYLNEFSIELKKKRVKAIYQGELISLGIIVSIPIFMSILFGL